MRLQPLFYLIPFCLFASACSQQETTASADESKTDSAAPAASAASDQPAQTVNRTLTKVTVNGKEVEISSLSPELQKKLLSMPDAPGQTAEMEFVGDEDHPPVAVVKDSTDSKVLAAALKALAGETGTEGDTHIVISDKDMSPEQLAMMKSMMEQAKQSEARAAQQRVGTPFPTNPITLLDGSQMTLSGKTSVVTVWASWCKPCLEEMPLFEQLATQRSDLQVVALNVDFSRDDMTKMLASHPIALPLSYDEGLTVYGALKMNTLPLTLVLDDNGVIRQQHSGSVPDYDSLLAELKLDDQNRVPAAP